jgi:hypothetical protein
MRIAGHKHTLLQSMLQLSAPCQASEEGPDESQGAAEIAETTHCLVSYVWVLP